MIQLRPSAAFGVFITFLPDWGDITFTVSFITWTLHTNTHASTWRWRVRNGQTVKRAEESGKQSYRLIVVFVADSLSAVAEKSTTLSFLKHYFYLWTYTRTDVVCMCARTHAYRCISLFIIFHLSLNRMRWGSRQANCRERKRTKRLNNFYADILNTRDIRSFALIRTSNIYMYIHT